MSEAGARLLGGSGTSPYGDLFRTARRFIDNLVLNVNEDSGLSRVNDVLVAPLTTAQSNVSGSLVAPDDLFSTDTRVQLGNLDANVVLRASDARIENLDTIGVPMDLFAPVDNEAHILNNTATFGVGDRSLRVGVRFLLSILGDGKYRI